MDVKYIGGDVPWTLPFGDHFNSSSYSSFTNTDKTNFTNASDLEIIARRHNFEPLISVNERPVLKKPPLSDSHSQWMNSGVLFTDKTIEPSSDIQASKTDFHDDHGHTFCYLCSINQPHHERTKPRDPSQRRKLIPYNNPKALRARSASLDQLVPGPSTSDLVSYRFIVRTGTRKNSGTRAQVFLYMYGSEKNWTSINLQTRSTPNTDGFPTGSIRTFCLKGPDIGTLNHLTVNLVGARSDKEWFLKEIEITNLNTSVTWLCEFNCWLPKKPEEEDYRVKPKRSSSATDFSMENLAVYILEVHTGGKPFAGTDSNIQVTIRGSTSKTEKLLLTSRGADLFEQNQLDTFAIVGRDIGELREMTVESDKSHMAADWDLREMKMWKIIPNKDNKYSIFYFPFNAWLGPSAGKLTKESEPAKSTDLQMRGPIYYHILVKTGKDMGAGTDANVYIIIYGKSGRTCTHLLDNRMKNDFERNTTSEFTIMDNDVGKIEQIKIWHDGSGIGAAWLLDSVTIRKKYSTCRLIADTYVQRLEQIAQAFYNQTSEKLKKEFNPRTSNLRDYDDLLSNRSILRSPLPNDRTGLQKKNVTWSGKTVDPKERADIKRTNSNASLEIKSGHFQHHAYWISSHSYNDKKWKINSIEETNKYDLDPTIIRSLLSDRHAMSSKMKSLIDEKDDEVYEFEAKSWLGKKGTSPPEIYLKPKSMQPSSSRSQSTLDTLKRPGSSLSKALSDYLAEKSHDENSKHSSKFDLGPLEKSPRSLTHSDRHLRDMSKTQLDDPHSSHRSDQKISSATSKRQEQFMMDKYHQRPSSPLSNPTLKIPSTSERDSKSRLSHEPTQPSRYSPSSSFMDTRLSSGTNFHLKVPTYSKESGSPSTSHRDFSERMSTDSAAKSKPITRTNFDFPPRSQIYNSAYGTRPMENF